MNDTPIFRHLTRNLAIAGLYYLTARLGLLLALPVNGVSGFWPPAGVALAAVLMTGWPAAISVFVGALVANFELFGGSAALPEMVAVVTISAGSTLQAGVGAWLIRRLVKTLPPDTIGDNLLAFGILALTTLIAPVVGLLSMVMTGLPTGDYLTLVWTWWLGDLIGILILTPALAALFMQRHKQPAKEPYLWALTSLIAGLAFFAFFAIESTHQQRLSAQLQRDSDEIAHNLQDTSERHHMAVVTAVRALYDASEDVSRAEFRNFTAPFLTDFPSIAAISWAPRVTQTERPAYEEAVQAEGLADFHIHELDAARQKIPATQRPEYFPVTFIEPVAANQNVLGFDNASSPARLQTISQARDSGEPAVTAPIQLLPTDETKIGLLVMAPVYQKGTSLNTVTERRANLQGMVVGAFHADRVIESVIQDLNRHDIELYLYDVTAPAAAQFIAFYPSVSGPQTLPAAGAPAPETLQTGLYHAAAFKIGERDWLLVARPGPAYAIGDNEWIAWASLLVGLAVAGAFLIYVSHRQKTEKEIRHLSGIVAQMADTVVITDINGVIEYVNPAFEQLTGYSRAEAVGQTPRVLKSGQHPPEFYQRLWDTILDGGVFQAEIINRKKNGELFYESKTITPIRDAIGDITHFVATGKDITERKKIAEDLHRREAEYRLIAENTADVIWILDLESEQFTYVSPSVERLRGYTPSEAMTQSLAEMLTPDSLQKLMTVLPERLTAFTNTRDFVAITYTDEIDQFRKDGSTVQTEVASSFVVNEAGKIQAIGVSRDITERKQAAILQETVYGIAEAAQAAESLPELYSQIHRHITHVMDAANFYIVLYDETMDLMEFVYSVDTEDPLPAEPVPPRQGLTAHVLRTGRPLLWSTGRPIAGVESMGLPAKVWLGVPLAVDGCTIGAMVVQHYTDANAFAVREQHMLEFVSSQVATAIDRKQALERLQKSQISLKTAQAIAHLGSWELDLTQNKLTWSDEIYRIFGLEPQEFTATYEAFLAAIHPDDREMVNQAYTNSLQTRQPYEIVHRLLLTDGTLKYVQEQCETDYDENGVPLRSVGTVQDITVRRRMELELRERMKELTALFAVSRLLENNSDLEVPRLCQGIVEILVPAMQFPRLTVPVLELDGERYSTDRYGDALDHNLSSVIMVNGAVRGRVSVSYTQNEPFIIPEEQNLLDNIARMLGLWLERKQSQTELQASEARFRQLAENIQEVFWMYDMVEQKIVYISPAYELVWGRSCQSLYQNPREYIDGILPEDRHIMQAAMERQGQGERVEMEYRVQRPDGSIRWVWDRSFPIFDDTGTLTRTAGVGTDITEVKNAQQALEELNRDLEKRVEERTAEVRQSEATYRALFQNSNDGIFLISPTGEELQANPQALNMIGYTWEEYRVLNQSETNAVAAPEQQADADNRFQAVLRGEHMPLYERTFVAKDGRNVEVEINLSPIWDTEGNIIMVQSVVRDITQRKQYEAALRKSRDQLSLSNAALEKASRLKDEFLVSMSHELRTPLTSILGFSEVLQIPTYGELNKKQLRAVKNIQSSGRHLLDLINDILDLSKIEAGKLEMRFTACEVADVCQASLQLVRGMANKKKQNIKFSMEPASLSAYADARRLKQMLVNLLSNAIKFTPEGGNLGLEVQGNAVEKLIYLTVWDEGIGIEADELDGLFKPFVQLDNSLTRHYAGTGLGLSLVRRMAELHKGGVKVESTPGEGSRFTIILPELETEEPEPEPEPVADGPGSLRNALVIEDNELDIDRVTHYLKEIGITNIIQPVMHGALEKAARLRPSVILLDLYLPDGFGLGLLTRLKADERTRDIPVIITSVEERRAEAMKLGAQGYLVKPFTQADLQAELAKTAALARLTEPAMVIASPASAPLVLLADDNESVLETLTDFLDVKKYRVDSARSGFELLERAPELHPDIMLVDIQMPGMDGFETIRHLRAHHDPAVAATPIIAITALAMAGDREKCLQAGANDYMSKPIALTKLARRINQLLKDKTE